MADSTPDYPVPGRILATKCAAERYLAAACNTSRLYDARYLVDIHSKPRENRATESE
ncbi:DUF5078 domain-containing protein [Mycobacteroides salmoniphilum]|uniref:DUF5078 domain-containing protein n=1 Tax=Mycobacteroides salmoniphilum TaxID=404941 RepID=UPI00177A8155